MKINHLMLCCALLWAQFSYGQWTALPSGTNEDLLAVHFYDAQNGVAAGKNSTILITTDGGSSWTASNTGEIKGDFRSVYMLHPDTIFAAAGDIFDAHLYRSVNGGQSWDASIGIAEIAKSKLGIVGMSYEHTYYSTDRGGQWDTTALDIGGTVLMEALHFSDSSTGFLTGNISGFTTYSAFSFRTEDGGLTWAPFWVFDLPNNDAQTFLTAPDPDTVFLFTNTFVNYLPGEQNHLVRLTDFYYDTNPNIQSWRFTATIMNAETPGIMTSAYFTDGSHGFAGSMRGDIYRTEDGGQEWELSYDGDTSISEIVTVEEQVLYAVGGNGLILKYALDSSANDHPQVSKLSIFPNPTHETIYVRDFPEALANATIRTFNGQLVRRFEWTAGDDIPVDQLAAGMYLLELRSGNGLYRSRFLKQ